jgi:peptidoglycan/LPS O-acetylase OafA/YrhL
LQFSRAFLPNKAQYFALGIAAAAVVRGEGERGYLAVLLGTLVLCDLEGGVEKLVAPLVWTVCLAAQCSTISFPRNGAVYTARLLRGWRGAFWWVTRVLQSRPLVWLGAVSYCIYLVNEPVQKLLGVVLALLVQGDAGLFTVLWLPGAVLLPILAAWWLHERIELPAQRYGRGIALAVNVQ